MKICVVGIGYVGLVTSACLAEAGNNVVCVDNNTKKIKDLKKGVIPIYEPGLIEMVKSRNSARDVKGPAAMMMNERKSHRTKPLR